MQQAVTPAPRQLREPDGIGFDPSRLFIRRYGERLLVIDQLNGRWLVLDACELNVLPLLKLDRPMIADPHLRRRTHTLEDLLRKAGVGVRERADPTALNTLILKLTKKCNISCSYCYDFENGDDARHADVAQFKRAVSEALELARESGSLAIILHGGEPMLVWDILEAVVLHASAESRRLGVAVTVQGQTNMTALSGRKVAFSEAHHIAWGISLDGAPPVNDRYRVRPDGGGSYALFERALTRYPEFVAQFPVLSTITGLNCGRLLETARHFRDLGMAGWDWSLFQPIGRARPLAGRFDIDDRVLLRSWRALFDAVVAGEFDGFPVQPVLKYLKNFIEGPGHNMCMRPRCGAARDLLSVSYDGSIEACDCLDRTGPLSPIGDLATDTLTEARATPIARSIRSRDTLKTHCADCLWYGQCGGTCLAHADGLDEVVGLHCAVSQLAFDRIAASMLQSDRLLEYYQSVS